MSTLGERLYVSQVEAMVLNNKSPSIIDLQAMAEGALEAEDVFWKEENRRAHAKSKLPAVKWVAESKP